tara:strand:- start:4872 stop:5243 length:372 start_codon:yes stop_codon:yes gene_type:complete
MTEEEKFQELGIAMDQAIGVIVEKAAELDLDPILVTKASVVIPFAILFGICRSGHEEELAEIATDLIVDAAQTVGKNSKKAALEAGDIKSAARETESKLYDGPLKAKDIPEQIKKELHEFFET